MKHSLMSMALLATLLALFGCSSARHGGDASQPPVDFAIGLTVDGQSPGGAAWYLLDADGVLRMAVGARGDGTPVPPIVRQLSASQRHDLWNGLVVSGLQAAVWEAPQVSEAAIRPGVTLFIAADGVRRAAAFASDDARVGSLIESLRTLAWLPLTKTSSAR